MSPSYKQQPTLQNVRIRTAQDALQVFFGVARNVLTLLTRRLDADERKSICSGNVYVWEDRSATTSDSGGLSMERWTDGMSWGPSRIREEFLFYYQRDAQPSERSSNSSGKSSTPLHESDKLIKQTYSVYVTLPEDQAQEVTRKWHLTAYFNQRTIDTLGTVDDVANVGRIPVPDGLFRSARAIKGKRDDIKRTVAGKFVGPDQSFAPSPSSGALYTIFPSTNQSDASQTSEAGSQWHSEASYGAPGMTASYEPEYPVPSTSQNPPLPSHYGTPSTTAPAPRPFYGHHRSQSSHPYPVPTPQSVRPAPSLVPLEYLENCSPPRRDPADERVLQQFALVRPAAVDRVSSESPSGSGGRSASGGYHPSYSEEASRSSTPHYHS